MFAITTISYPHRYIHLPYAGTRIPLIIRAPLHQASAGKHSSMMVELIDVFPTLAELLESPPTADVLDGTSLVPVLNNASLLHIPTGLGTGNKSYAFS